MSHVGCNKKASVPSQVGHIVRKIEHRVTFQGGRHPRHTAGGGAGGAGRLHPAGLLWALQMLGCRQSTLNEQLPCTSTTGSGGKGGSSWPEHVIRYVTLAVPSHHSVVPPRSVISRTPPM